MPVVLTFTRDISFDDTLTTRLCQRHHCDITQMSNRTWLITDRKIQKKKVKLLTRIGVLNDIITNAQAIVNRHTNIYHVAKERVDGLYHLLARHHYVVDYLSNLIEKNVLDRKFEDYYLYIDGLDAAYKSVHADLCFTSLLYESKK